jgi:hypothetical protein
MISFRPLECNSIIAITYKKSSKRERILGGVCYKKREKFSFYSLFETIFNIERKIYFFNFLSFKR